MQAVNKHLKSAYSSEFSSLKENKNIIEKQLLKKKSNNSRQINYSSSFRRQNKDKRKVQSQLRKDNESESRSRSKSVSSYCEAGCFRKGQVSNSKAKNSINFQSQKPIKMKAIDEQKLYRAIQKFHFNLSSMPLDHLVTHTHPQQWLKQQKETYQQLNDKLKKLEGQGKQNKKNSQNIKGSNQKIEEKSYQYYKSKVESIQQVLRNIENNMQMLMKLYQQQLRSYNSNSSIRSKQSFQSPGFGFSLSSNQSTPTDSLKHEGWAESQKRKITNNENYKIQESLYQIHEKNGPSSNQSDSNIISQENSLSKFNGTQTENAMWRQLQENIKKFMDCTIKNQPKRELQCTNKMLPAQTMAQMLSTCRTEQSPSLERLKRGARERVISTVENSGEREKIGQTKQEKRMHSKKSKEKDFVKFDLSTSRNRDDSSFQTKRNEQTKQKQRNVENSSSPSNNAIIESISQFFAKSGILLRGNSVAMSEQLNNLLKTLGSQNGNGKVDQEKKFERHRKEEKNNYKEPVMKPLLWQITALKQQLKQKNKIIEQLLIRQQELETVIDLFRHDQKQNRQSMSFSMERIKNLEATINKYEKQIKRMEHIDSEMRQSIKNQSIFVNTLQSEKITLQQKLQNQRQKFNKIEKELIEARQKWEGQLRKIAKGERIAIEKMEIYKQKYYQLLHEVELKKIVIKGEYSGKAAKLKQIWGILGQHRRNIYDIDQPQQEKIVDKQLRNNKGKRAQNKDFLLTQRINRDSKLLKSYSNIILKQKREFQQANVENRKKNSIKEIMDLESQQSGVEESFTKNSQC